MPAHSTSELLEFKISNFNKVAATAGGFLTLFGLVSYLLKEKFYLGEALISTIAGVIFSPHATHLIRPLEYANGNEEDLEAITLYFTRLVLGVQLVIAGIQLPAKYLKTEWRSLALLLGPGMCAMWITTALLVWALVPSIPFLYALAIGSCVTPTDPVLSASIVKGKFADKNIPRKLQDLIVAESGANDGLGYPFLFLALYLIQFTHDHGLGSPGGAGTAMGYWFGITWAYEIVMSVLYGALVGYIFRVALRWAEERKFVDRESLIVFSITIALFIVGTLGMLGSDDVLACFIAGNVFSWDNWFQKQVEDDTFQATIDMLLNVAIFAWYGAVAPWHQFVDNSVIPIYRLIFIGVLVLLFRRLPMVLAAYSIGGLHQIQDLRQAAFVGFFGPMGVSAIFYLYTTREFLRSLVVYEGVERADARELSEVFLVVVWFVVICSIVAHGLTIPLGKLWFYLPRTLSRSNTMARPEPKGGLDEQGPSPDLEEPHLNLQASLRDLERGMTQENDEADASGSSSGADGVNEKPSLPTHMRRIGGTIMHDLRRAEGKTTKDLAAERRAEQNGQTSGGLTVPESDSNAPNTPARSIRYADEENGP